LYKNNNKVREKNNAAQRRQTKQLPIKMTKLRKKKLNMYENYVFKVDGK